jgi:ATP-dependent RNA helicase RhlE
VGDDLDRSGIKVAVIHGNKSQGQRKRALGDFKAGRVAVLVATDIAARGLDIAHLPLVVNYDLPLVAEDYIHRVGRTGRAGLAGRAVSLVSGADRQLLRDIQRLLPAPLEQVAVEGFAAPSASSGGVVEQRPRSRGAAQRPGQRPGGPRRSFNPGRPRHASFRA